MSYALDCSDSTGLLSINGAGAVVCSVGSPVVVAEAGLGYLSTGDVATISGLMIGAVALAASWRVVMKLLGW